MMSSGIMSVLQCPHDGNRIICRGVCYRTDMLLISSERTYIGEGLFFRHFIDIGIPNLAEWTSL